MSKASEMEASLTAEDLRRLFRYEPESGKLFWCEDRANGCVKAGDEAGYVAGRRRHRQVGIKHVVLQVHRIVWAMQNGAWPKNHIDHVDGNPLNNRIENLREVTNAENCLNRSRPANNTSGVIGVSWFKRDGKWKAQIRFRGRNYHLGYYDDLECAKAARLGGEHRFGFHENHGRAAQVSGL